MTRIHVICEGQTEEMFVNGLLYRCFFLKGIELVPGLIGKPGHKGGNLKFQRLLSDVRQRLLNDSSAYCTTLFDYYGLPSDFPGRQESAKEKSSAAKAACLLHALYAALQGALGAGPLRRFIPYVQMHEFEGLLFSDPEAMCRGIGGGALVDRVVHVRRNFASPEDINDAPVSAPSKRIQELFPHYDKPLHGSLAAQEIGLETIRRECPLFNDWLKRLEACR